MADATAEVLELAEPDYRYGRGRLFIQSPRSDRAAAVLLDGEWWVPVEGTALRRNGTRVGAVRVLVRAAVLPQH